MATLFKNKNSLWAKPIDDRLTKWFKIEKPPKEFEEDCIFGKDPRLRYYAIKFIAWDE